MTTRAERDAKIATFRKEAEAIVLKQSEETIERYIRERLLIEGSLVVDDDTPKHVWIYMGYDETMSRAFTDPTIPMLDRGTALQETWNGFPEGRPVYRVKTMTGKEIEFEVDERWLLRTCVIFSPK